MSFTKDKVRVSEETREKLDLIRTAQSPVLKLSQTIELIANDYITRHGIRGRGEVRRRSAGAKA